MPSFTADWTNRTARGRRSWLGRIERPAHVAAALIASVAAGLIANVPTKFVFFVNIIFREFKRVFS